MRREEGMIYMLLAMAGGDGSKSRMGLESRVWTGVEMSRDEWR